MRRKGQVQRDVRRNVRGGASIGARLCFAALAAVFILTLFNGEADARRRRHHHAAYNPPYASIVVDANTGTVLQATNADSPRHPASLTKMMTLYLLFERLEAGKIKLSSELPVSEHAAGQAPSKLGLKPGETIKVEDAIRAIVTKSANDVAVTLGEALGGDEPSFGRMMTAKAHALGMKHTTYRNASGLPNDAQVTTARDQALLGRALQDRFPQYFHYFATRSFLYKGRMVRGHNRLLGNVDGVDGIKTGYIRASGFNIVTSVNRNHRHIVAVVFGGRTARLRDAQVRRLIAGNFRKASTKRTAPPVTVGTAMASKTKLPAKPPTPLHDPRDDQASTVAVAAAGMPSPGSTAPIRPTAVRTVMVHPGRTQLAALSPLPSGSRKLAPAPATASPFTVTTIATIKSEPPADSATASILGALPIETAKPAAAASARPAPSPRKSPQLASAQATVPLPAPEPAAKARGGWMIQVGAFPDEAGAKNRLTAAQAKAKDQLGKADPFTEKVAKGSRSLYRARFAGLDKNQAETACKHLKRNEIPCMLLKN